MNNPAPGQVVQTHSSIPSSFQPPVPPPVVAVPQDPFVPFAEQFGALLDQARQGRTPALADRLAFLRGFAIFVLESTRGAIHEDLAHAAQLAQAAAAQPVTTSSRRRSATPAAATNDGQGDDGNPIA